VNLRRLRGGVGSRGVIGGIALPNDASVALHEKFGMQKVAYFKQVGFKLDPVDRRRLVAAQFSD
jgi:L-amino acid N-acyltransferase YncA